MGLKLSPARAIEHFSLSWVRCVVLISSFFFISLSAHAQTATWQCSPPRIGAVLPEGGWMVERRIGTVAASPEFTFPLQLVYLSTREQRGPFGGQWFCPQLESNILPKGKGTLLWQTPGGNFVLLQAVKRKRDLFSDGTLVWEAKLNREEIEISNKEGWRYLYKSGRLLSLGSPTGRVLEYSYKGNLVKEVSMRDPKSGGTRSLIGLTFTSDDLVESIKMGSQLHRFSFERGREGKLMSWSHAGEVKPDRFFYGKVGVLASIKPSVGEDIRFSTEYAPPVDARGKPELATKEQKVIANYRLLDDGTFKYSYGDAKVRGSKYRPGAGAFETTVIAENKAGGRQSISNDLKNGVTTKIGADGSREKSYYYLAPGQPFNGKLRRVEQNDVIVAEYRYDKKSGLLSDFRDKDGTTTFYEYASTGSSTLKPVRILRGTGEKKELVVELKYDSNGRVIEKIDADRQTTKYKYNARGELENVTDLAGVSTAIAYDAFGRVMSVATGDQKQSVEYDDSGRIKSRKAADGQTGDVTYDARGFVALVRQNGVPVVSYKRNERGAIVAQTDAIGRVIGYDYDPRGNLLAEIQPNGSITRYEYDSSNRRVAQIDGNGNRIAFAYDPAGHLIKQTNPLGQSLTWRYDASGQLIERTNGVQKVASSYDEKGRLQSLDYGKPGEKLSYRYDSKGRLEQFLTDSNGITFYYDSLNRIIGKQFIRAGFQGEPPLERVLRYTYNARGQKLSAVLSEKKTPSEGGKAASADYRVLQQTETLYSNTGHLQEIRSNGRSICVFRNDASGRLLARTYGNGMKASYTYDAQGRQTQCKLEGGPLSEPLLLAYSWDPAGQMLARVWNGEAQYYSYDPAGQLVEVRAAPVSELQRGSVTRETLAKYLVPIETYRYDKAGNMLEKMEHGQKTVMTYDPANQLKTSNAGPSATTFDYDKAGRMTARHSSTGSQVTTYGLLDKVLILTKTEGNRIAYDYYPDGQLATKRILSPRPAAPAETGGAPSSTQASSPQPQVSSFKSQVSPSLASTQISSFKSQVSPSLASTQVSSFKSQVSPSSITEEFVWDGLGLLFRNGETYAIEPHISGGVPLAATRDPLDDPTYIISDILGTTLAIVRGNQCQITPLTAFGKPLSAVKGAAPTPPDASQPPAPLPALAPPSI